MHNISLHPNKENPTAYYVRILSPKIERLMTQSNWLCSIGQKWKNYITRQSKSAALWSRSYFACTAGGATIETLKSYVESQATPD